MPRQQPSKRNKAMPPKQTTAQSSKQKTTQSSKQKTAQSSKYKIGPPGFRMPMAKNVALKPSIDVDATSQRPSPPEMPVDSDPINIQNGLNILPRDVEYRFQRPWYFYDLVDPVSGLQEDFEGGDTTEGSGDLSDDQSDEEMVLSSYMQEYIISIPDSKECDPRFFQYGKEDLIRIHVSIILRNPSDATDATKVNNPGFWKLGRTDTYEIHAGYLRVLSGLVREVEFATHDGITRRRVFSRAHYLTQVLDLFVKELETRKVPPPLFRSKALNPILQRQLQGINDQLSDRVKEAVGTTLEAAALFYLRLDPLDPALIRTAFRNIIHITSVRSSLEHCWTQCSSASLMNGLFQGTFVEHPHSILPDKPFTSEELEMLKVTGLLAYHKQLFGDLLLSDKEELGPTADTEESVIVPPQEESEAVSVSDEGGNDATMAQDKQEDLPTDGPIEAEDIVLESETEVNERYLCGDDEEMEEALPIDQAQSSTIEALITQV